MSEKEGMDVKLDGMEGRFELGLRSVKAVNKDLIEGEWSVWELFVCARYLVFGIDKTDNET